MAGAGFTTLLGARRRAPKGLGRGVCVRVRGEGAGGRLDKTKIPAAGRNGAHIGVGLPHPLPPLPQPHATSRGCAPLSPGYAHAIGIRRNTQLPFASPGSYLYHDSSLRRPTDRPSATIGDPQRPSRSVMDSKDLPTSPMDQPNTPLQEGPSSPNDVEPAPAVQQLSLADQAIQREVDEVIYSDVCLAAAYLPPHR